MSRDPLDQPLELGDVQPATPEEREAPTAEEHALQERRRQMRAVLDHADGRAVLLRVLGACGIYREVSGEHEFARGVSEGRRRVGRWLMGEIMDADATAYPRLLDEHRLARESELRTADPPGESGNWLTRTARKALQSLHNAR